MSLDKVLTEAIKNGFAPQLKQAGFRKRSLYFHRNRGSCHQVIQLQKSQGNSSEYLQFYINIGVGSPDIWEQSGQEPGPYPKPHVCQIYGRYEDLLGDMPPYLAIDSKTEISDLVSLLSRIAERLLPLLDPVDGPRAMLNPPLPTNDDVAAQIHYFYKEDAGALEALQRYQMKFADRRGTSVTEVAQRLRLTRLL